MSYKLELWISNFVYKYLICDSEALTAILALTQMFCPATLKYFEHCVYFMQHIN
jgi:hypothetical protein